MLGCSHTCSEAPRIIEENRRYRNFAPFVRQTGERKAQTCAMAMLQQRSRRASLYPGGVRARCSLTFSAGIGEALLMFCLFPALIAHSLLSFTNGPLCRPCPHRYT